ncbi:hypothetical protein POTOM_005847 [Populus tomentosa]|uniref:Uncharacterized protein n=1 Tax=Populus tomentosa TaxID=118781 RepID=A0A8X8ASJ7_POPTO|nr:hypothetical protein POTOM_005847 [Populus tomentosa]
MKDAPARCSQWRQGDGEEIWQGRRLGPAVGVEARMVTALLLKVIVAVIEEIASEEDCGRAVSGAVLTEREGRLAEGENGGLLMRGKTCKWCLRWLQAGVVRSDEGAATDRERMGKTVEACQGILVLGRENEETARWSLGER